MNILSNIKECLINKLEYITYIGHPYVFARHVVGRFGLDHAHTPALVDSVKPRRCIRRIIHVKPFSFRPLSIAHHHHIMAVKTGHVKESIKVQSIRLHTAKGVSFKISITKTKIKVRLGNNDIMDCVPTLK